MKKVTRADIARYLDTYVIKKSFVFGSMLSPDMVKKGFDQAHFEGLAGLSAAPAPKAKKGGAK